MQLLHGRDAFASMKNRLRVNEWECIHLKSQDRLRDAYWINRAWRLDLEWNTHAVFVVTSLISAQPVFTPDGLQIFINLLKSEPWTAPRAVFVCSVVCFCVYCLSVSACMLGMSRRIPMVYILCIFCLQGQHLIGVSGLSVAEFWREVCDVSRSSGTA